MTMLIGRIENATRSIGKAQGYNELPVRDGLVESGGKGQEIPTMTTAWFPTPDELAAINAGAAIHLTILGRQHPPVMLGVGPVPGGL